MNRQSKVKRGILIAVIMAGLIALIGGTYARYTSTGKANARVDIAKWHVELKGKDGFEDISTTSKTVDVNLVYDNNDYVKDGKIAPGRSAHFDVELDPSGSAIAQAWEENSTSKISITGVTYTIGNASAQDATIASDGTISLSESLEQVTAGNIAKVTVTLAWDDDNGAQSASDTKEGVKSSETTNGKKITVPVTITAMQHV